MPESTGHILLSLSVFFFLTLLAILVALSIFFFYPILFPKDLFNPDYFFPIGPQLLSRES